MAQIRQHRDDEAVRSLIRQLAETQAALQQVLGDDVDAVINSDDGTSLLLPHAQARLLRDLEGQVGERTAALQDAYENLQAANEELQITGKELQEQNATLAVIRSELEAERRRYYDLFDFAPDGYLVTDPLGVIQEANRAAALLLGVEARFLRGKPLVTFVSGDDARALTDYLARLRALEEAESLRRRMVLRPRNGEPFVAALTAAPVRGAGGRFQALRWLVRDVSERVAMEEALRAGEERYRLVADFTYDWEYWTGPDGEYLYVSPSCRRITGYDPEDFQRDPDLMSRIIHPDDLPLWEAHTRAERERAKVQAVDFRIRTRDGQERWISHACQPVYGRDDTWLGWRGSNRDVTHRKEGEVEREELLAEAEEGRRTLDALMDYVPQGITLASAPEMQVMRVSRFGQELLGGPHAGQSVGQVADQWTVYEVDGVTPMAEEDLPLVRAIHHGEVVRDQELIQVNARGEHLWLSCDAGPILDRAGGIAGGIVAWRDVTEHRRAEQALRDSEKRYRELFEGMIEGFALHEIVCDDAGRPIDYRFLKVNPAIVRLTGLDREALVGRTVLEVLPDTEPFWIEAYGRVALSGEPIHFEQYSRVLDRHYAVSAYRPAEHQFACLFQDITDRIEGERVLRENEEKLRVLFEILPVGLSILDAERTVHYQNPALGRILDMPLQGLEEETRQQQRRYRRLDGSPLPPAEFPSNRAVEEGRIVRDVEIGIEKEDGTVTWVNVSAAPLPFDDWNVIIVTADITEQVLARWRIEELAAEAQHQRLVLEQLIDAASLGIAVIAGPDLRFELINPAYRAIHSDPGIYLLGRSFAEVYAGRGADSFTEALRTGRTVHVREWEAPRHAVRRSTYWNVDLVPLPQPEGGEERFLLLVHEVTDQVLARQRIEELAAEARHQADELERRVEARTAELVRLTENLQGEISVRIQTERDLRASEERFRQMAENIDEIFMLIDPATERFLYLSPRYETVWGRARQATYEDGTAFLEGILPEDRERLLAAWRQRSEGYDEEFRLKRPDGQLRWIRLRAFAVFDGEGEVRRMAGVAQDITREKRAQAALIQAERLSMAGQLAASLAHEINNPIQSALGCLDLAVETLEEGEDPRSYLEVTTEALARAARVVSQLRSLHRESPAEQPQSTDVGALLERVLLLTRKRCETADVEVNLRAADSLPPLSLKVDGMQQVFLNLVLNAVEAMPGGGRLAIRAEATEGPAGVAVHFADSGAGMTADVLEQLFEPFFTTKEEGLGLGLFVSQNIVRQHGGHLDAESHLGKGTTFTVWLPAAEEESVPSPS
ncbi:MAG: PAS domain S-box protein [Anaerolineae bacterium]